MTTERKIAKERVASITLKKTHRARDKTDKSLVPDDFRVHPIKGTPICGAWRAHMKEKAILLNVSLDDLRKDPVLFQEYRCCNSPLVTEGWGNGRCRKHGAKCGRKPVTGEHSKYQLPVQVESLNKKHNNLEEELSIVSLMLQKQLGIVFGVKETDDSGDEDNLEVTATQTYSELTDSEIDTLFVLIKEGKVTSQQLKEFINESIPQSSSHNSPTSVNREMIKLFSSLSHMIENAATNTVALVKDEKSQKIIENCKFKAMLDLCSQIDEDLKHHSHVKKAEEEAQRLIELYAKVAKEEYKRRALDGTYVQKVEFIHTVKQLLLIAKGYINDATAFHAFNQDLIRAIGRGEQSSLGQQPANNSVYSE